MKTGCRNRSGGWRRPAAWFWFAACGALAAGTPAREPAPPAATDSAGAAAQAVDRLVRSTRRGAEERAPFELQYAPPETPAAPPADDTLERAIVLMQEQDYPAAIPLLEDVLDKLPTVEAVWEALGWSYYHSGQTNEADRLWQQFLVLRPESAKAHSLLAQLALLRNDWRAADTHLRASLALDPQNYDIRYWYAQNLFRLGHLDEAIPILEKLIAEDDQRYDVKVDLARFYPLVQRYEDSLDLWTDIIAVIPDNRAFGTEYARALMLVGSLAEADEQARRVLAEDPALWEVMNLRADLAEISQRPDEMVRSLRGLIKDAKDPEVRARLRVRLGARLVTLHRQNPKRWPLTLALDQYEEALAVIPTYVPWLNQYAQIALMAHQPVKARQAVDRILRDFNPINQQALRTRFEIAMLERDFTAAEQALEALYDDFQPDNPYRFLELARLEVQRGRYQEALAALDRLEEAGDRGAVLTLLYHGLTESEWMALTSTRRLREHLIALRQAGFTFLAPQDLPDYLARNAPPPDRPGPKPWLARQVDNVRYAFTGKRRDRKPADRRPAKVAVVTFDDGLRSSFSLGTPVAQELNIPFGMFVITSLEELNAPMYAAWEEIRAYRETGVWQIGSHLMHANTDQPAGPEPSPKVFNLPNRIWLPERHRLETLREWSRRVRNEFSESRARIARHLGLAPDEPMAVAYPYGEIGQEEGSNVAPLLNPVRALLNEADREYQAGFIVDRFGYTCAGENPLLIRRYEPGWDEDAGEVLEQVLANHPVFMARRLRAEIATLMDRPFLAEQQIELLRRDGYPERLLRELEAYTRNRLPAPQAPAGADEADRAGTSRHRLRPSNIYGAGAYRENKSNKDILQRSGEARAGLNLTAVLGAEAAYRAGTIEQTVTSNIWYTIEQPETSTSSSTTTVATNGGSTTTTTTTETTVINKVQTNRIETYAYDAEVEELRGALTLRINDTATLTASLGQKILRLDPGGPAEQEEDEIVGALTVGWQPYRALQLVALYDHDLVPSARAEIVYDGFGLNARWKIADSWDVAANARYLSYDDDNAMVQLFGSSFWQLFEKQGVWGGLEAGTYTMDEKSDLYWSPYWDTRFAGVVRLRRAYQDYFFQFDLRLGQQSEKGRPEDMDAWRNLKARAESDGTWYAGAGPAADWDTFVGLGGTYRQRLWRHLDLIGGLNINFLRNYSEHDLTLGLQYNF